MQTTKKKVSIFTLILIIISLLSFGAAGYFWYQNQSLTKSHKKTKTKAVANPVEASPLPIFLTLKPFTISLPAIKNGYEVNKILYIGMVLRLTNEEHKTVLLEYLPELRSDILLLLSKQSINKLKDDLGKQELKELVKTVLSRSYDNHQLIEINEVLFTDFIIR